MSRKKLRATRDTSSSALNIHFSWSISTNSIKARSSNRISRRIRLRSTTATIRRRSATGITNLRRTASSWASSARSLRSIISRRRLRAFSGPWLRSTPIRPPSFPGPMIRCRRVPDRTHCVRHRLSLTLQRRLLKRRKSRRSTRQARSSPRRESLRKIFEHLHDPACSLTEPGL